MHGYRRGGSHHKRLIVIVVVAMACGATMAWSASTDVMRDTTDKAIEQDVQDEGEGAAASNPLAKVRNTDLRWQYFDLDDPNDSRRHDIFIDGSLMFTPRLKFKYELHYWETDITVDADGNSQSEHDWESLRLKPIFFPLEGAWGTWKYRLAVGVEWILDFRNDDKGIGSGAEQIAPFLGVALLLRQGTTLIPLYQHFLSYRGEDVNTASFRLIALQQLPYRFWFKLDGKVPFDLENDTVPASAELQLGRMFAPWFGTYVDGLIGIGGDKPYDYGVGLNVRFVY